MELRPCKIVDVAAVAAEEVAAVVVDRLPAEVAHVRPALARHQVAAVGLEEGLLAAVAVSDQRLRHLVLDVGPLPDLVVLLDLVAALRDVAELVAESAALLAAVGVEAPEHLVLLGSRLHDGGKLAEGAALEAINVGLLDLGKL